MQKILVRDVSKNFGKKKVLNQVTFEIPRGSILGIVGPSGSGKSVLIKSLIGFLKPDLGTISIPSKIGFSMQNNALYENLTLEQNLKYFAKIFGVKESKEKINVLLHKLSLDMYRKVLVSNLSGGTKKRADIACALLNDPEVLILDEPFAGLDTFLINQLSNLLKELQKNGITIIFSSHLLNHVENLSTHLIFIREGVATPMSKEQLRRLYR